MPADPGELLAAALGHGFDPFPWQSRLLEKFIESKLPRALDLPTGLGKTSVMAIWLVARICRAKGLPRRLVYVVDRRAVVDQATRVAEQLAAWVASDGALQEALGVSSLPVSTLRGQFADNRRWLENPAAPAIVVGTVDMVGSRVLFQGYGCSRNMRPYHAGLLGSDSLFVVDEAHLVPPFEAMLEALGRAEFWPDGTKWGAKPARVLSLSATGRSYEDTFGLEDEDREHPVVDERITASKHLAWRDRGTTKQHDALAQAAWQLASSAEAPRRILVFCNSRDGALKAEQALGRLVDKERGKGQSVQTELLVGGRRVKERLGAAEALGPLGFLAGEGRAEQDEHSFLFATSAGEVGIDLDADDAVMDVVAWERMVQRLGRVNRRGKGEARVAVIATNDCGDWLDKVRPLVDALPPVSDPIEGADDGGGETVRDASLAALEALAKTRADALAEASTPAPLRPGLSLPLLEAWSMTSLREHSGRPDVAPWLRGWTEDEPQTAVVWRQYLPSDSVAAYIEATPTQLTEVLELATRQVCDWLCARAKATLQATDTPESDAGSEPRLGEDAIVAWVLDRAREREGSLSLANLAKADGRERKNLSHRLAHRQILVDARLGGLSPSGLLDPKAGERVASADTDAWVGVPARRWRVRKELVDAPATPEGDWRETLRIPWREGSSGQADEVREVLCVDRNIEAVTSEASRSASRPQLLVEHQRWVASEAAEIAEALALPKAITHVLVLAARLHDEGKRAASWQRAFSASPDGPWAKTRGPVRVSLLEGYRHEFGSLPHAERDPAVQALDPADRDLCLHLIAAHHGHARPTITAAGCEDAPPSVLRERTARVARRFVALQDRYGPWRLAWLEALLRAADQRASRRNDEVSLP